MKYLEPSYEHFIIVRTWEKKLELLPVGFFGCTLTAHLPFAMKAVASAREEVLLVVRAALGVWPEVFHELNCDFKLACCSLLSKRQCVKGSDYSSDVRF